MKKYQLWLERKTYTQHLDNLIRIKMRASECKTGGRINTQQQKVKKLSCYQSQMKLDNSQTGQEFCYIITARQLQKHKMRLVRSRQIVRENEEIVKRINRAKPFITNNQPVDYANYKLKRVKQRLNVGHSFSQKHKNFQQFAKMHAQVADPTHKYQLDIKLLDVQIRMLQKSTEIMLQIIGSHSLAKSQFVSPSSLKGHNFQFTFEDKIPDFFTLRLHSFKGLEDTVLGDYIVARPEQGQTIEAEWPTVALPGVLKGRVKYTRLLPKFWPIKRFK